MRFNKGRNLAEEYINISRIKRGYKDQLIYYYNNGIGETSDIANIIISERLISTIEKRYTQLGGVLPIPNQDIEAGKGKKWTLI
tara:strand:- start:207 stop:458 length:252 start_codon:yes stop_codon:yes gene_type:complete